MPKKKQNQIHNLHIPAHIREMSPVEKEYILANYKTTLLSEIASAVFQPVRVIEQHIKDHGVNGKLARRRESTIMTQGASNDVDDVNTKRSDQSKASYITSVKYK